MTEKLHEWALRSSDPDNRDLSDITDFYKTLTLIKTVTDPYYQKKQELKMMKKYNDYEVKRTVKEYERIWDEVDLMKLALKQSGSIS